MKLGYINSGYDNRDLVLDYSSENKKRTDNLPECYDFSDFLSVRCKNQGEEPVCVPFSLGLSLEIRKKLNGIDNYWIDTNDIFKNGGTEDGMMIRDALKYVKKCGYKTKNSEDREKIHIYGKLMSFQAIKQNVYNNGPCIMALRVRDVERPDFWNGEYDLGGHAIACVGWTDEGLLLMNSWGNKFGNNGRVILPYKDYNKENVLECWGFIS